jgi:hypothetical protein
LLDHHFGLLVIVQIRNEHEFVRAQDSLHIRVVQRDILVEEGENFKKICPIPPNILLDVVVVVVVVGWRRRHQNEDHRIGAVQGTPRQLRLILGRSQIGGALFNAKF